MCTAPLCHPPTQWTLETQTQDSRGTSRKAWWFLLPATPGDCHTGSINLNLNVKMEMRYISLQIPEPLPEHGSRREHRGRKSGDRWGLEVWRRGLEGKDKSGADGVYEVRVMGMCCSLHSGDQQSLRGKDEWVGTSSLLFIMVGGRTGIHHNHSTTLWWRHRGFPQIQTRTHERDEKE